MHMFARSVVPVTRSRECLVGTQERPVCGAGGQVGGNGRVAAAADPMWHVRGQNVAKISNQVAKYAVSKCVSTPKK